VLRTAELLAAEGADVVFLPVDYYGRVNHEDLVRALEKKTDLVSIQWANNETGVIQDIPRLAKIAKERGALFHSDAVQVVGKVPMDVSSIPVDFLSFTGHKLHAPQGIGGLIAKDHRLLRPLVIGGEQENEVRAGTENLIGIAVLGYALEVRRNSFEEHVFKMRQMRDHFESLVISGYRAASANGTTEARTANTTNIRFGGIDGRALTALLDQHFR